MSTHTPVPWAYEMQTPYNGEILEAQKDNEGDVIFHFKAIDSKLERNIAFIVRACNAHEEMVKALEIAIPELVAYYGKDHFAVNVCRQAIAKAEEGRA